VVNGEARSFVTMLDGLVAPGDIGRRWQSRIRHVWTTRSGGMCQRLCCKLLIQLGRWRAMACFISRDLKVYDKAHFLSIFLISPESFPCVRYKKERAAFAFVYISTSDREPMGASGGTRSNQCAAHPAHTNIRGVIIMLSGGNLRALSPDLRRDHPSPGC
jgi:hypothetical protein